MSQPTYEGSPYCIQFYFKRKNTLLHTLHVHKFFFNVGLDSKLFDLGTITDHAKFISKVKINVVFESVRGLNEDYLSLQMTMSGLPLLLAHVSRIVSVL